MDLKKMSIIELKATAYDQLAMAENIQKSIIAINQELSKRMSVDSLPKEISNKNEKK